MLSRDLFVGDSIDIFTYEEEVTCVENGMYTNQNHTVGLHRNVRLANQQCFHK